MSKRFKIILKYDYLKQLPLLATTVAMILLILSSDTFWIRFVAAIVGLNAVVIFIKSNLKKN
jgi:hypothetical protein